MTEKRGLYKLWIALLLCLVQAAGIAMYGQTRPRAAAKRAQRTQVADSTNAAASLKDSTATRRPMKPRKERMNPVEDSIRLQMPATQADSLAVADSIAAENKRKLLEMTGTPMPKEQPVPEDTLKRQLPPAQTWVPNPTKATWLALVIPGGGQIYNRKYWKLPIFYGGFAGCAYALTWNGKMYRDYMNAYKDATNNNWTSTNITDLLPPGYLDRVSKTQLTETLRKRKDTYRRYRDMSIFAFIGVYLLSVVDAYVDAELSNFDITPDLSMRVEPAVINTQMDGGSKKNVGVQCSFRF